MEKSSRDDARESCPPSPIGVEGSMRTFDAFYTFIYTCVCVRERESVRVTRRLFECDRGFDCAELYKYKCIGRTGD